MKEQLDTLRNAFVSETRADGSRYVALKDDAPSWVRELVYALHDHGRILPDDAIYAGIAQVADELADLWTEGTYPSDLASEAADGLVSVYDSDLIKWAENSWARAWVDEAIEENGCRDTLTQTIALGQYRWFEHVAISILDSVASVCE